MSYSTAIAKHFQTENFQVHPSDRLPFPLELRNHNAVLENHSGRAARPKIKLDIFIRFDTIPTRDGCPASHPAIFRQHYITLHYITVFSAGPTTTRTGPAIQVSTIILTRSSADADNRLDAFSGQSRSTNMVPFHMLHIVSYCAIVTCL